MGPLHLRFCLSHKKTQYISFFLLYSFPSTYSRPIFLIFPFSFLFLFFFLLSSSFFFLISSSHPHIHGNPYATTSTSRVVTIHESHTHHATIFLFTHCCCSHVCYNPDMLPDVSPQSRCGCYCFAIALTWLLMFHHHHRHHCYGPQPWYFLHYPLPFVGPPSAPPSLWLPLHSSS